MRHIDIKIAFLHCDRKEVIYMQQHEGYIKPGDEHKVSRLNKVIYKLKKGAKTWTVKIWETLKRLNFKRKTADPRLFRLKVRDAIVYIIC